MNAFLETTILVLIVGGAAFFVALRMVKTLRGGKPSCCSDRGAEIGPAGTRMDAEKTGTAGGQEYRPSCCAGCAGCGPSH